VGPFGPQAVCERPQRPGGPRQKTAVEINHAEKHLKLLHSGWPGEVCHRQHVLWERLHPFSREVVAQELGAGCPEDALLHVDDQPVLPEAGEELAQVDSVRLATPMLST
jgi:hypothetical protein